ncbi:MAG: helix-turn-helix transcriptional regulator [Clostridiales bacterium]|nr:helix-turn-helix transcriptional regulator [Clostridiales bacterium]
MDAQKFGTFIAKCRKEKNMTQSELAEKLMVTDKAVSRWERGKGFPDIALLLPLADALKLSVVELMRSEKISMKGEFLQNDAILVDMMENAVEMKQKDKHQDRNVTLISCITMFFTAFLIKYFNYGSIGGGIAAGGVIAFIPIGIYLLLKSKDDFTGKKVYIWIIIIGIFFTLILLTFLKINPLFLVWGTFLLFCVIIGIFIS